jgi:hypothetical protein
MLQFIGALFWIGIPWCQPVKDHAAAERRYKFLLTSVTIGSHFYAVAGVFLSSAKLIEVVFFEAGCITVLSLSKDHRLLRTCSVILSFWGKERIITLHLSVLYSAFAKFTILIS